MGKLRPAQGLLFHIGVELQPAIQETLNLGPRPWQLCYGDALLQGRAALVALQQAFTAHQFVEGTSAECASQNLLFVFSASRALTGTPLACDDLPGHRRNVGVAVHLIPGVSVVDTN